MRPDAAEEGLQVFQVVFDGSNALSVVGLVFSQESASRRIADCFGGLKF